MQTSSPNAREPHESAPRLDAPTRTVSTDTRPCSRFPPRYLPLRLSSPMHKHVARRSRVTEPSRNWETPLTFVSRRLLVAKLALSLSFSRYESIIRLFQFIQNIKKNHNPSNIADNYTHKICAPYILTHSFREQNMGWLGLGNDRNSREILWFHKMNEMRLLTLIKREVTGD